jgi:4-hydroxy-tetrahydrodipicolinate synthase
MTFPMMTDSQVKGAGVISVVSNVAPGPVTRMVRLLTEGNETEGRKLMESLSPLFGLVMVKTQEQTPYGDVSIKARNPMGIKLFMSILGMPSGMCRRPLGKASKNCLNKVLEIGRTVQQNNPEILQPVADFFGVDIDERLHNPTNWEGKFYPEYE